MKVILKQDVNKLGQKDDIITVKDGYGRNYLIPKGYGIQATAQSRPGMVSRAFCRPL